MSHMHIIAAIASHLLKNPYCKRLVELYLKTNIYLSTDYHHKTLIVLTVIIRGLSIFLKMDLYEFGLNPYKDMLF